MEKILALLAAGVVVIMYASQHLFAMLGGPTPAPVLGMDVATLLRETTAFITALGVLIVAVLQVWAKISSERRFDKQDDQLNNMHREVGAVKTEVGAVKTEVGAVAEKVEVVHQAANGLSKAFGEARLAQGTAEGTAVGLQQGRDEGESSSIETSTKQPTDNGSIIGILVTPKHNHIDDIKMVTGVKPPSTPTPPNNQ